jgi:chorismate mutase
MATVVRALRGATTVERDEPQEVTQATRELLEEMLSRNSVRAEDLISVVFTATPDLVSEFPAAAARALGIADVPLLCATEIAVPGAVERCVRVLIHLNTERSRAELHHVYLHGASHLREDLTQP